MRKLNLLMIFSILGSLLISCMSTDENLSRPVDSPASEGESGFYALEATTLDGQTVKFSDFKGKKVLIVNTASKCGFTPQYEDLQKLHEQYSDKVTVLGFPCNQFGGQEPGNKDDIESFCRINYGVTFQMFDKVDVKGNEQHPVYKWLTDKNENGWNTKAPSWNFCKYLINEKGELVEFYGSAVKPTSTKIITDISK
jgi:glutathione peroxidase